MISDLEDDDHGSASEEETALPPSSRGSMLPVNSVSRSCADNSAMDLDVSVDDEMDEHGVIIRRNSMLASDVREHQRKLTSTASPSKLGWSDRKNTQNVAGIRFCYNNPSQQQKLLLSTLEYHVAAPQVLALYTLFYEWPLFALFLILALLFGMEGKEEAYNEEKALCLLFCLSSPDVEARVLNRRKTDTDLRGKQTASVSFWGKGWEEYYKETRNNYA
jgi:hypothetical protein